MATAFNPRLDMVDMSWEDAQLLTGREKQNATAVFVGRPGSSKSVSAMYNSYNIARNESRIKKRGDPDYWEEYFPYEETLVTINKEKMLATINKDWKNGTILLFDEIQKTANARDWTDEDNRFFNDLFQIGRPRRLGIIGTIQEIFAGDKQFRHLFHHYYEMIPGKKADTRINPNSTSEPDGMRFCKPKMGLLRPLEINNKQVFYIFNKENNIIWDEGVCLLPPPKMMDYYEKLRAEEEKADRDRQSDERKKRQEIKKRKEERQLGAPAQKAQLIQNALIDNPDTSVSSLAKIADCSETYARQKKKELGF